MRKKTRTAKYAKNRVRTHPRAPRAYCRSFAEKRAEAMDSMLTPKEQAAWNKIHYRRD